MKKTQIFLAIAITLSSVSTTAFAEDNICKHNTLHFATSVEKEDYVKNLLSLKAFNLTELNKQCQTAPHIAVEIGNLKLLETFYDYLGHLNIENGKGENLLQTSFLHQQPNVTMFLISKGENPHKEASNGMTAYDYQKQYGNNLTDKILKEFDARKDEKKFNDTKNKNDELLNGMYAKIEEKELTLKALQDKLMSGDGSVEEKERITTLLDELHDLKKYISDLEGIIKEQALELKKYQDFNVEKTEKLLKLAEHSSVKKNQLSTHIPEGQELKIITLLPTKMEDIDDLDDFEMTDISSDGEVVNDSMKIFELFSKPVIEIKKKNNKE
jgi:hypothetical protein